jgi:hypothetical protein
MKSNDNKFEGTNIQLPFPPTDMKAAYEMEVYARFMRYLREVPTSRPEICILAATQHVADIMDAGDAPIAKILVDLGLRAPRMAFPESYLQFVDKALMRSIHEIGYANEALKDLQCHWQSIGEDKFAAFKRCYPTLAEGILLPA